jgi:hypothetical protein
MKKLIILILALFLVPSFADARSSRSSSSDIYVQGYYTKKGKYIKPYYRTAPNKKKSDNYGCIDNKRC